jgi:DNA-binding phage protein
MAVYPASLRMQDEIFRKISSFDGPATDGILFGVLCERGLSYLGVQKVDEKLMEDGMASLLRKDPSLAAQVLSQFLADGDQGALLVALHEMTEAFGGIPKVAELAGLRPAQLCRGLSRNGNPPLSSISATLKAMGMQLLVRRV